MINPHRLLKIILTTSLLVSMVIGTGFYFVAKEKSRMAAEEELTAIAILKSGQLDEWRRERIADARVMIANPFISAGLTDFLNDSKSALAEDIRDYFRRLEENYDYDDIQLVDVDGRILMGLHEEEGLLCPDERMRIDQAFREGMPILSEAHVDEHAQEPHISIIVPVMADSGISPRPLGAVLLICNLEDFLYPLIQSWPTPSESGETLLIRRDGDDVLFLNELRHQQDTAMKLRLPLTRSDLPAVMAVKGVQGLVFGKDYRGIEVIAVLQHVPDSSWYMVSKMDVDEAFSDWRSLSSIMIISLIGLLLFTGSVILYFSQRDQKEKFLGLYRTEAELRASEKRFLTTLKSIGEGVITTDVHGLIDLINPVAENLTGWKNDEASGRKLEEVFQVFHEDTGQPVDNPVGRILKDGLIISLANHTLLVARDGKKRPIADSGAPILNEQDEIIGIVLVFRDMTEERAREKQLRESERILNDTGLIARIGGWEHDLTTGEAVWTAPLYDIFELDDELAPPGVHEHLFFYPPDHRKRLEVAYLTAVEKQEAFNLELQMHTARNRLIWCRLHGEPVFKDGRCVKIRGTLQDITKRKHMELAVMESQRRLHTLLNNLPGMAYRCSNEPEWPMEFVSNGTFNLTGYTSSEMSRGGTVSYGQIIHPEDREEVWGTVQEAIRNGRPFEMEYRILTKDGRERTVWERGLAVSCDIAQDRVMLEGFITDISSRREAEKARDEARYRLDLALAASNVGLWDWYPGTNEIFLSRELKEQIGYLDDEFMNDFVLLASHLHPEDREKTLRTTREFVDGLIDEYAVEFRLRHKNGNYRWIFSRGEALRDDKGMAVRVLGAHVDITRRKDAEAALLREKDKAELYLNIAPFIIVGLNASGGIFLLNDEGADILDCHKEEVLGKNWIETFIPYQNREEAGNILSRLLGGEQGELVLYENSVATLAGAEKNILWKNTVLRDDEGEITGLLSSGLDITQRKMEEEERRLLQEQLLQAQKMESVGRLAGGVAHDFNNMLQLILGHTELALEELPPEGTAREDLEEVHNAAERAAELTRQLLAFARKQVAAPEILNLNKIVGSMLKMMQRLIGEDIDLAWRPADELWPVKIDPVQVDQILANLCVNARDAITGPGKLTIETQNVSFDEEYCQEHRGFHPGKFVMLAVSDDGCGMDHETMSYVFEPFFTTKPVGKGTGLGLATVYGIIKQNDGFINVYSELGHGTTFKIYLPHAGVDADDRKDRPSHLPPKGHDELVLLVEDEPAVLDLANSMIERLGYRVLKANHPEEALQIAAQHCHEIKLLVTDVVMPHMHGRDLAKRVKELCPKIKTLFMSGYTADVIAHRGVLDEDVNYIQKPFSSSSIAKKIREILAGEGYD